MNTKPLQELRIEITPENYERAITANSGSCLVADAIKEQYPQFSTVKVDVATVRVTNRKTGEKYTYLTPPSVAESLVFFDQGWREESLPKKLRIRTLLRVTPITRSASDVRLKGEKMAQRLAQLEAKERNQEPLTSDERRSLGRLRKPKTIVTRPTSEGFAKVEGDEEAPVIRGGKEPVANRVRNPNLLSGRDRHFAGKRLQPSQVFTQAVKEAVLADRKKQRNRNRKRESTK